MGRLLCLVLLLSSLTGCILRVIHVQPLQRDELGLAAHCEWHNDQPSNCVRDKTRVTINLDYLEETFDGWQQCIDDEYNRRKL